LTQSIFEDTNPKNIKDLLQQIQNKEAVLPDFQRDFVWDPGATAELIVSIANNYPAGSLLRIRNTHNYFTFREFEGAPSVQGTQPTYLVLDGQQRLTSLYQAFYGVGDYRYYLDLKKLLAGEDFEDALFYLKLTSKRAQSYANLTVQGKERILPLGALRSGGLLPWILSAIQPVVSQNDLGAVLSDLDTQINARWLSVIESYQFPVVTLSDSTSAAAVCTIFETLNRTGVKLSPFELLTARFYHQAVNLRQKWADALQAHPVIAEFDIDPYYMMQIISLLHRPTPSCKRSEVLELDPAAILKWWDPAIRGLATALTMLRDECGIITPNWLPYNTIVIPFAAAAAKVAGTPGPQAGVNHHNLIRWYWCSVFGQTYETSPNSHAAKDVTELTVWLSGGAAPDSVTAFQFDPNSLQDTTPRQRAVYRGTISLVLSQGARDFHMGAKLTGALVKNDNIQDHHIFPQAYLNKTQVPVRLRDCVLNRTLIDQKTNIRISDRAPSDYLLDIHNAFGTQQFDALLDSHLLPSSPQSPLWSDDFAAFRQRRQDALWAKIQQVTS